MPDALIAVMGSLVMATPMMCIPVFIFVALCKVSELRSCFISDFDVCVTSLHSVLIVVLPPTFRTHKARPHRPEICDSLGHTCPSSRCASASSLRHRRSPAGGTAKTYMAIYKLSYQYIYFCTAFIMHNVTVLSRQFKTILFHHMDGGNTIHIVPIIRSHLQFMQMISCDVLVVSVRLSRISQKFTLFFPVAYAKTVCRVTQKNWSEAP